MTKKLCCHVALLACLVSLPAAAAEFSYTLQPGDLIEITVWKEAELSRETLVAPDGSVSVPLAGALQAGGHTVSELENELRKRLEHYIAEPEVSVALRQVIGSRVFVIGKVNRPGMYLLDGSLDVMQALSLAGGTTPYADLDNIRILRRETDKEVQVVMKFEYNRVARGSRLEQNIALKSGDTVVVP